MVALRATMPNADELLWPGTLVTAQLTLRMENAVTVPSAAVQVSQTGSHVFVVENGVARIRPVKVLRVVDQESVIGEGLAGRRDGRHRRPVAARAMGRGWRRGHRR